MNLQISMDQDDRYAYLNPTPRALRQWTRWYNNGTLPPIPADNPPADNPPADNPPAEQPVLILTLVDVPAVQPPPPDNNAFDAMDDEDDVSTVLIDAMMTDYDDDETVAEDEYVVIGDGSAENPYVVI